ADMLTIVHDTNPSHNADFNFIRYTPLFINPSIQNVIPS
ncbi:hypothetical protein D018_4989B, partial [Vibrio parahaemolyticus VP2007-007]